MAGFLDGILFHKILQTHGMVSSFLTLISQINIEVNMFWDGLFEGLTLFILFMGLTLLWQERKSLSQISKSIFIGSIILGFGLFNLLEGLINHQIVGLHHVIQSTTPQRQFYADLAFLLLAVIFMGTGLIILKKRS